MLAWNVIKSPINLQAVLEKFEFFPIKCRVLRAAQQFNMFEEADNAGKESHKLKTKVLLGFWLCPLIRRCSEGY